MLLSLAGCVSQNTVSFEPRGFSSTYERYQLQAAQIHAAQYQNAAAPGDFARESTQKSVVVEPTGPVANSDRPFAAR